jgi:diaminopimelate epimerase
LRFSKFHGTGNDFVMIEDLGGRLVMAPSLVAAMCERGRGIGADGVIRIGAADGADFFMDYSNADGEGAEMCGNGIRCLGKYVYERGLTSATELDVATRAGIKHLVLEVAGGIVESVTVNMGPPRTERQAIPMTGEPSSTFIGQSVDVGGRRFTSTAVSMGNPHCVVYLERQDDLSSMDVPGIGRSLENRVDLFPSRTNVEFVNVVDDRIETRVWERGSGETMACGTGACAALVACSLVGRTGRVADVVFPGGLLHLAWREDGDVYLTGPAVWVFDGELDPAWVVGTDGCSGMAAGLSAPEPGVAS